MPDLTRPDGRAAGWDRLRDHTERLLGPGLGLPTGASQPCLHPTDDVVAVTVEVREELSGYGTAQVALVSDGDVRVLRPGHRPAWSPDGTRLAHLVDAAVRVGDVVVPLEGNPERLEWSPAGDRLLVVVAEPGSEVANLDGSGLYGRDESWLPHVSSSDRDPAWRRLVVVDLATLTTRVVGRTDLNVWDAVWCGADAVAAVCSDGSSAESAWYTADLRLLDVATGADRVLVKPPRQIGALAASGTHVAYVDAVCSDRDLAAGELRLHDLATGEDRRVEVPADVSCVQVLDDGTVAYAGVRGLTTVLGTDAGVLWESERESTTGAEPQASFRPGRAAFVRTGFALPPEVCLLDRTLASLRHAGSAAVTGFTSEVRRWTAPDGLELESWLHLPATAGPHPLVVSVHGGPVSSARSAWPGGAPLLTWLLSQGYAVWQPNPRGSSGRGLAFAGAVVGDMGGADATDLTSGVQALIADGTADAARIGVMGGSYGGFMSAWLVTQSALFAAAVPMFPVTDWTQQHGISCIPGWDALFLDGRPYADGQYRDRSPLAHAAAARTPTLLLAGARDRATPAGQALSLHRALVAHGVPSECVTYPEEGHGTKNLSATIDAAARISDWFDRWMPAGP